MELGGRGGEEKVWSLINSFVRTLTYIRTSTYPAYPLTDSLITQAD